MPSTEESIERISMGTFSMAIFGDDFALDVRAEYLALIADGIGDQEAHRTILDSFKDSLQDSDDGPIFWLSLASTQWEYGRLDSSVKAKALKAINQAKKDDRWAGSPHQSKRFLVLDRLAENLRSNPLSRRTPRRRVVKKSPSISAAAPDESAHAEAWTTGPAKNCPEPFTQVVVIMKSKGQGGGGVFAAYCPFESEAEMDRSRYAPNFLLKNCESRHPEEVVLLQRPHNCDQISTIHLALSGKLEG